MDYTSRFPGLPSSVQKEYEQNLKKLSTLEPRLCKCPE
jgi:hypothetical protein